MFTVQPANAVTAIEAIEIATTKRRESLIWQLHHKLLKADWESKLDCTDGRFGYRISYWPIADHGDWSPKRLRSAPGFGPQPRIDGGFDLRHL